jgi:cytochrome c
MAVCRALTLFTFLLSPLSAAAQDDLVVIGELVFFSCTSCHVIGEGKVPKVGPDVGPHLNALFGRKPGSLPDFEYSEAMVEFGRNKVWSEATLTAYVSDPAGVVPGNRMKFPGNKKPAEVQALLAYLATFDPEGMVAE